MATATLRDEAAAEAYFGAKQVKELFHYLTRCLFADRPERLLPYLNGKIVAMMAAEDSEQDDAGNTAKEPLHGGDVCVVRVVVECEGPGAAKRRQALSWIVGNARTLARAREEAAQALAQVWSSAAAMTSLGEADDGSILAGQAQEALEQQSGSVPAGASPAEAEAVNLNGAVRRLQQILASEDPEEIFKRADADCSGDMSFEEWERAFGDQVDRAALEALFEEMDSNKDGKVSWQEFKDGLDSMPTVGELDIMMGVLQQLELGKHMAQHLVSIVRARMNRSEEMTTDAVREHMRPEDILATLEASKKVAEERTRVCLEMLEQCKEAIAGAEEMNAKFASSPDVSDAIYGEFVEFLDGIERQQGLPATNLMEGMKNQFCHSAHAQEKFKTSNYGGTETTAKLEFEFVTEPDLDKEYPGGRRGQVLEVFLLAAGATRTDGGERLDMPLSEIQEKYGVEMLDSVMMTLLRKGKEAFLTEGALKRVAQHLRSTADSKLASIAQVDMAEALEQLAAKGTNALRELRKAITHALKKATESKDARIASTGGTSFKAVARDPEVTQVLRRLFLDAHAHTLIYTCAQRGLRRHTLTYTHSHTLAHSLTHSPR